MAELHPPPPPPASLQPPLSSSSFRQPVTSHSFRTLPDYQIPDNACRRSYSDLQSSSSANSYSTVDPYVVSDTTTTTTKHTRSGSWSMNMDPEVKRKKRLAGYRVIALEGKLKSSVRKSFRWLKGKYLDVMSRDN